MSEDSTKHNDTSTPSASSQESPASDPTQQKLEELQKALEEALKSADSFKDQFLRKAAEFENFKRRTEADYGNSIRMASEGLILALLPTISDFMRSLKAGQEQKDYDAFYKGVELIYTKMMKTLEARGLQPFDSVGKPFDVQYHDALLQVPNADVPPHTVLEEIEKGYKLNDKVLKHAKVIVSSSPAGESTQTEDASHIGETEKN